VFGMPCVLVVDDDDALREAIVDAISDAGYVVEQAENGRIALDKMRASSPCLVLLDLMMPVMDGYGVLDELAKDPRTASVPVVVLSAKAIPDEAERVTAAGACRFIEKPFDPDELASELAELLQPS
jgi:CheY-like chemotaxis protein